MRVSWWPDRDGFGTVLGPADADGYCEVIGSMTFAEAVARFGEVFKGDSTIPVVVDA